MVWVILALGLSLTAWSGAPIGVGLGLTGLAILHFVAGGGETLAVTAVWNVFTDFTLSAVPLFLLMGEILMASGVSNRLYTAVAPLFHRVPGKLLHTNIAVCTLFGAVSGASMSTAAAVGSVAYPELKRRGYHAPTVVGTLAAGGTLGLLIPPSLSLLIYGATMEVSIGRLFLAGILPGLMLAGFFMLVIFLTNLYRSGLTPPDTERPALVDQLIALLGIWPLGFLIFAVLGTIYLGWATPTEAAGLGVVASVLVGATWGDLTLKRLSQAVVSAIFTFGAIGFVVLGALILAQAISILALPMEIMSGITDLAVSRFVVLALVVVFYLILGCFFDGVSLLLMTIPLVFPIMTGLGFDPVWLGVIITILIEIGMLTPPVGINLFVLVAITDNEVNLAQAARATVPYWICLLLGVVMLTVFPGIALYLPGLMD